MPADQTDEQQQVLLYRFYWDDGLGVNRPILTMSPLMPEINKFYNFKNIYIKIKIKIRLGHLQSKILQYF